MQIEVVCDDQIHAPKVAKTGTFQRMPRNPESFLIHQYDWNLLVHASRAQRKTKIVNSVIERESSAKPTNLLDDKKWDIEEHGQEREGDFVLGGRTQYRLSCPLCEKLPRSAKPTPPVPVRAEVLDPILDTLSNAGVFTISLRALGARVSKQYRAEA